MAIQIRGSSQIISASISADRINLTDTFDFSSGVLQAASPTNSSDVATKGYVDGLVADGFQAGDGISIDTGTSPDTISVLTATDGALQFIGAGSNELSLKLDGSTLSKTSSGVKVADGGIADAQIASGAAIAISKLAQSTISGVSLGDNLYGLSASGVLSMTSYDGSAAVSDLQLNYDAAMFDNSAGSLIIKNLGVDSAQLADGSVTTNKIASAAVTQAKMANDSVGAAQIINGSVGGDELANNSIQMAKLSFSSYWNSLTPNSSTTAFDLSKTLQAACQQIFVVKNGLVMKQVASSPSGSDEYTVSLNGGTAGVGQITFGAAPTTGDDLRVWFMANN